jgi:hypothetical protein
MDLIENLRDLLIDSTLTHFIELSSLVGIRAKKRKLSSISKERSTLTNREKQTADLIQY